MNERTSAPALVRSTHALESASVLDLPVRAARTVAERLIDSPSRRRLLEGEWLGHALHPTLTDVPLGVWTSATLLDLIGGKRSRSASTRLIGLGLAAAVPTALTGLAEWGESEDPRVGRVGLVHAGANLAATALYGGSFLARLRGAAGRGRVLALLGAVSAAAGGYLGGHLTEVRHVSTYHPSFRDTPAATP